MAVVVKVIWAVRKPEYFCKPDWTASISLIRLDKLAFWRKAPARRCSWGPRPHPCPFLSAGSLTPVARTS
jgi:hypothetical protein